MVPLTILDEGQLEVLAKAPRKVGRAALCLGPAGKHE